MSRKKKRKKYTTSPTQNRKNKESNWTKGHNILLNPKQQSRCRDTNYSLLTWRIANVTVTIYKTITHKLLWAASSVPRHHVLYVHVYMVKWYMWAKVSSDSVWCSATSKWKEGLILLSVWGLFYSWASHVTITPWRNRQFNAVVVNVVCFVV